MALPTQLLLDRKVAEGICALGSPHNTAPLQWHVSYGAERHTDRQPWLYSSHSTPSLKLLHFETVVGFRITNQISRSFKHFKSTRERFISRGVVNCGIFIITIY